MDVVEVWAQEESPAAMQAGWLCGSGHALGGSLVLTAAHVVCRQDRPLNVVKVRAPGGELLSARVAWHLPVGVSDVAVLAVSDPRWVPLRRRVRFGRLVTTRPRQPFEATGFPGVQASVQERDTEQASGMINPRSTAKAGRLALSVDDPPSRVCRSQSPWAGMSGAGVFCGGLLTAVIVEDPDGFDSHRLSAVPVSAFCGDPGFLALLAEYTGQHPRLEPVELRQLSVAEPVVDSPLALLRADLAPTPFRARPEVGELLDWCRSNVSWSARLMVGPGGQGKTRLARQLMRRIENEGWASLILADSAPATDLQVLGDLDLPVLVVVDYAETRVVELGELSRWLRQVQQPVRLLLLARTGERWQADAAASSRHLTYLADLPVHRLGSLESSTDGRREAWSQAVATFAPALTDVPGHDHVDWPTLAAELSAPGLDGLRFATILSIQMDALVALLQAGIPLDGGYERGAATVLLLHETRYWASIAATRHVPLGPAVQRRAVAMATLWGANSRTEAQAVLAAIPGIRDLREDERIEVGDWLAVLYREPGRYWSRLQPDRLAEELVAAVLGPDDTPTVLAATASVVTADQMRNALTVLAQAAVYHPDVATPIKHLISSFPSKAGVAALPVATRSERPDVVLRALREAVDQADPPTLLDLLNNIPASSVVLAELGWQVSHRLVEQLRVLTADDPESHYVPTLAGTLSLLAGFLGNVGRLEQAVGPAQEAVERFRLLVNGAPAVHQRNLATALDTLAKAMRRTGRHEEAIAPAEQAVAIRRAIAEDASDIHQAELAGALRSLADSFAWAGQSAQALSPAEEAVAILQRLQEDQPEAYRSDLAGALQSLADVLSVSGHAKAPIAGQQAIALYRELADSTPDSYLPHLAAALHNLARNLVSTGHAEEAVSPEQEAIQHYRRLAETTADAYLPTLAAALYNLAVALRLTHRHSRAVGAAEEAVKHFRSLSENSPDTDLYLPDLAASLYTLAKSLFKAGRLDEARERTQDAIRQFQRVDSIYPGNRFTPNLADARQLTTSLDLTGGSGHGRLKRTRNASG